MQMVEVNSKNVDSITKEGKTYLYFTAGFSPYAAAMEPVYRQFLEAAAEYAKRLGGYCRFNLLELPESRLPEKLPTMLVFRDGVRVDTCEGIVLPERYVNLLRFY